MRVPLVFTYTAILPTITGCIFVLESIMDKNNEPYDA